MKILRQLALILLVYFGCEAVVHVLHIPFPATILGLLVLLGCLELGVIRLEQIEDVCDFFLRNMAFFFIPSAVGIMASYHYLAGFVGESLLIIATTTFLVFGVSASVTQALVRRRQPEDAPKQ
ncbi:MAG: CidA/LrgA family protein [Puniceicoccales bacterium]|jgi:holin-like protein|nr:CidA/LrgA family protein [Puniceicoccales bacterium]